jgi:hypothetical protein
MISRPKLLIISFSTLVSDPRVLKQIALFSEEYAVATCGYGPAPDGVVEHFSIPQDRVHWKHPKFEVLTHRYRSAYRKNPAVSWVLDRVQPGEFDAVLANDADTAGVAVWLAPRRGFHVDLHEYSPLQNTELARFRHFVAPFLSWQIRCFVSQARSTTTVCESLATKYSEVFGFHPKVVMNAPPFARLTPGVVSEPTRLVHAGAALANRRLEVLIDAVKEVGAAVELDFYLTSNDPAYLNSLKVRAGPAANITFREPVAFHELVRTLNGYDVGLHVLAPTNFNNANALPNKFFEYVQARLALVVGPSPEMAAILRSKDLGVVSADFSAAALAIELRKLDRKTIDRWKANSHAAASELSAENQVPVWRQAIGTLMKAETG